MKLMETSDPWNELMKESLYEDLFTIGKQSRERLVAVRDNGPLVVERKFKCQ